MWKKFLSRKWLTAVGSQVVALLVSLQVLSQAQAAGVSEGWAVVVSGGVALVNGATAILVTLGYMKQNVRQKLMEGIGNDPEAVAPPEG